MATLVLQFAGAAVGGLIGGPLGAVIGRAAGAIAGGFIDAELFGAPAEKAEGPRLQDLRVMGSTEGAAIPRVWGRMRVAGQVISATNFEEVISTRTEGGSKGSGSSPQTKITEYQYFANFAVALAEGPIARIGRVWADGKEFDVSAVTSRLYQGSEEEEPDNGILAKAQAAVRARLFSAGRSRTPPAGHSHSPPARERARRGGRPRTSAA